MDEKEEKDLEKINTRLDEDQNEKNTVNVTDGDLSGGRQDYIPPKKQDPKDNIKTIDLQSGEEVGNKSETQQSLKQDSEPTMKQEEKLIDITEEGIVETTEKQEKQTLEEKLEPIKKTSEQLSSAIPNKKTDTEQSLQEAVEKGQAKPKLKTVRTFQEDIAKTLKKPDASLTKIILAEKDKQRSRPRRGLPIIEGKNRELVIGFGIVMLAVLVTSVVYLFFFHNNEEAPRQIFEVKIPTLIFPDYQKEIHLTSLKRSKINTSVEYQKEDVSIPLGKIIQLYITKQDINEQYIIEDTDGYKILLTSKSFFDTLDSDMPSTLERVLSPEMMLGFHSSLGNNPFLIFEITSYENAFAGMLEWEKEILDDVFPIFKKEDSNVNTADYRFEDVIISNKDVRAVLNKQGKLEFAYSFADKNTLVFINNESTLQEIFRRLRIAGLERSG